MLRIDDQRARSREIKHTTEGAIILLAFPVPFQAHPSIGKHWRCGRSSVLNCVENSTNLCTGATGVDNPPDYTTSAQDTFTVTPGLDPESTTVMVSEFSSGQYDIDQCFTAAQSNKKINTNPGSVHIAEIVTSAGNLIDTNNLSGVTLTLTLPSVLTYDAPGNAPAAHVLVQRRAWS